MIRTLTLAAAALLSAGTAIAAAPQAAPERPREASIAFPGHSIRDFEVTDRYTVYLKSHRQWYRASLMQPCFGLRSAHTIGVSTRGGLSLDRFGEVIVDGQRCRIHSLVKSEQPVKRAS